MDAEMEGVDLIGLFPMSIGSFLVDVPGDWEIVDYPDERVTVVREPFGPDDPLLSIPGFVIPNVALRFFEQPSSTGGAARSATQEAAATYDAVPGTVLLAVAPMISREGLPGRAHVMSGSTEGQPFISSRWYIGNGASVLELTVTGPATPMPELMELGQRIAQSVRTPVEQGADITPVIPEDLRDREMMDTLMEQASATGSAPEAPGLEFVSPILAARHRGREVPQTRPLEPEAWSSLAESSRGSTWGRLMRSSAPAPHEGLVRAGLATKRRLTDVGAVWADLAGLPPSLILLGERHEGERSGEIRLDGMDCLATLDLPFPTDREVDPYPEGTRLVGAFLTIGLPTVLLDWCGLRADWFADLKASAPSGQGDVFGRGADRDGPDWTVESGGAVMEGIVATEGTRWTVALPDGQPQLSWYQPDRRGPLLIVNEGGGNRVRLESTTGLVLHETLSRLFRDVARVGAR